MSGHSQRPALLMLGAFGLTAQMILLRELYVLFAGNEIYIGIVFSSWLLWAGAGSAFLGAVRKPDGMRTIEGGVLCGAAVLALSVMVLRVLSPAVVSVPGEIVPYGTALLTAFLATAPCGLIGGYLFSFAYRLLAFERGRAFEAGGTVYAWEAWGSGLAGIVFGAIVFSHLSTFVAAACFLALSGSIAAWKKTPPGRSMFLRTAAALLPSILCVLLLPVLGRVDLLLESHRVPGYTVIRAADSPYGRISAAVREDQSVLFVNTVPVAASPDPAAAEETVHIPMLCHASPRTVLMLGGTMGDVQEELRKYDLERAVGVELDGTALEIARRAGLSRPQGPMTVYQDDPRLFLAKDDSRYDVIICGMGEPSSLQMNRYYTRQFFRLVRKKLAPGGIFGFALPGSENLSLPAQEGLLRCEYATLLDVFPDVRFLPGGTCHFIASNDTLSADLPGRIIREMKARDLQVTYLMPSALAFRFSDLRMRTAADVTKPPFGVEINDDLGFSGYVYDMISWHSRLGFAGAERLFPLIGRRRELFLVSLLILAALYAAAAIGFLGRPRRRVAVSAALVAGFSGMAGGISMLVAFQVMCSALYQWVTILTGMFMAGAGAGSAFATRLSAFGASSGDGGPEESSDGGRVVRRRDRESGRPRSEGPAPISARGTAVPLVHFILLAVFLFLAVALPLTERQPMPVWLVKPFFLLMELILGLVTGGAFVIACGVMGEKAARGAEAAPVIYAFDLLGGCLGAALFGGIMLPLLGLPLGLLLLAGLNGMALAASGLAIRT